MKIRSHNKNRNHFELVFVFGLPILLLQPTNLPVPEMSLPEVDTYIDSMTW